ncbi:hypothetical protein VPH35_130824 [Triticum aestivum]
MGSYGRSYKKDVLRRNSEASPLATGRERRRVNSGLSGGIDSLRLGGREDGEGLGHAEQPPWRNGGLSLFCFDIIYCNKLEALPIILCRLQCVLLHCLKYKIKKGN